MTDFKHHCGFIAIVGRPNVGKSSLMNQLIGQKVSITSKKAQTTRHRITGIRTQEDAQFIFVDTPGFQNFHKGLLNEALNKTVKASLNNVDCVLFVLEAMRFTPADQEVLVLLPTHIPVILVVNKVDKTKDRDALQVFTTGVNTKFAFAAVEVVSAKHGHRLGELFEQIRRHLPESIWMYPEHMITDKSERFLSAEIVREKLFRYLGEELPYEMNVEVEMFSMDGDLRRIDIGVLVNKENQKPIVIGRGGEKLKKISTEARIDMEKLFGGKVFLQVWVKVKSGWADDVRFLREFGSG